MFGPMYYDRQGFPIEFLEWALEMEKRTHVLVQSRHKERGREFQLSTVWLGLDHNWREGRPLIFETMVFDRRPAKFNDVHADRDGVEQMRWSTEEEALAGHDPWAMTAREGGLSSFLRRSVRFRLSKFHHAKEEVHD